MSFDRRLSAWYLDAAPTTVTLWLSRLHWSRVAVNLLVLVAGVLFWADEFPVRQLAPLVAASALLHIDIGRHLGRVRRVPTVAAGSAIVVDVLLLTGLLELSGGPSNPFVVIYLVPTALAAATLGRTWGIVVGSTSTAAFGALVYSHLGELVPSHHRLVDFPTHLLTIWLALAVLAELSGHFIRQATTAIGARESQLAEMRAQAAHRERLMSLTTLAAGAAHELSSPLATIAIAARELERSLARAQLRRPADADADLAVALEPPTTSLDRPASLVAWTEDAQLIREQVDRCRAILDQMSGRAGGSAADLTEPTDLAALFSDVRLRLPAEQAERVHVQLSPTLPRSLVLPRAGLSQVLVSLIKNAFDATTDGQPVRLQGEHSDQVVRLIIEDEGTGMSADTLRRAGEPFFTTKDPGRGFGLGLFLARMFAERWGGSLTLTSDRGTRAILELPLSPHSMGRS
jgi:two-component system sensor histidine kinase RegB